ncbi:glycosyltransferase [Aeromonas salmonicida]|uniref:glycosyltransferase n=1 Tax=Aeromonas salmonicida TaxID=645 RepID=UPI00232CF517|nr:glycosyltransferase [Aeromonas salmonicida]WCH22665.1 glycosyltransferase [Aeromonas salmonicida]
MFQRPLFSIVLPTRDRPDLVLNVLKALELQTFSDFEVIISDNGCNAFCEHVVTPFLKDKRFKYKRSPYHMNMCDSWEFAIGSAQGKYITVFGDKFILRSDALSLMAGEISKSSPDVLTWQYEFFDVKQSKNEILYGGFHPLLKPGKAKKYNPALELKRRFSFDFPLFCRSNKPIDSYGKIYSGVVKTEVLTQIKDRYGRIFHPMSPDFTSMIAILNESKICVDLNQTLMLVINMDGLSNGEATRKSIFAAREYLESYGVDADAYWQRLPISGFGVGHNSHIAAEFEFMKSLAVDGPIKNLVLDKGALAFWAREDLKMVCDLDDTERSRFEALLLPWLDSIDDVRRHELEFNMIEQLKPASSEIYHSGLNKTDEFIHGISAEHLAYIHWHDGVALPRKPVTEEPMDLFDALNYLAGYNNHSCQLLDTNL